jgi:hypothetical protein
MSEKGEPDGYEIMNGIMTEGLNALPFNKISVSY